MWPFYHGTVVILIYTYLLTYRVRRSCAYSLSYDVSHRPPLTCACRHRACVVSRDLCIALANISHIFKILHSDLFVHFATYMALPSTINMKRVISENSAPPCVKGHATLGARSKSRDVGIGIKNNYRHLEFSIPLCLFTMQFHGAATMIGARLQVGFLPLVWFSNKIWRFAGMKGIKY